MEAKFTWFLVKFGFFSAMLFSLNSTCAQEISRSPIGEAKLSTVNQDQESEKLSKLTWVEDLSARTEFNATYKAEGGYIKVEHNQIPIHRKVNGNWEKIDPSMVMHEDGWHAPNQNYPVHLNSTGSFAFTTQNREKWEFGTTSKFQGQSVVYQYTSQINNSFFFSMPNQAIHKEILAFENGIKYNYKLLQNPGISSPTLVFTEKIVLPKGLILEENKEMTETYWGLREVSTLVIKDAFNAVQGRIDPAYAVDADKNSEPASYHVISLGDGVYELQIVLSNDWLNDATRSYPVLLDPLVVGPTSDWLGGQMPSCMSPQQNKDSILVTIPAGITPISLAVRSSFYADPWTTAIMSMGVMQFSTSCNVSQTFQVVGSTGTLPGTAYLDSINMSNPLLCCFPQSCSPQQFYLRKHLARSAPGTGCNTTYIRYDPFTTQWPFRAIVYGRTIETYATEWAVSSTPRCADDCEFTATAYVRYGVPPFSFTHPWQDTVIVKGTPSGCNSAQNNVQFQLTIPNCPIYCDENYTSLPVPNPTVVDACGATLLNFPAKSLTIKPAPQIVPLLDTVFCAGDTLDFDLSNCLSSGDVTWSSEGLTGTNQVNIPTDNNLGGTYVYNFLLNASFNGCDAEPYFQPVYVFPLPELSFQVTSENTFLGDLVEFDNTSTGISVDGNQWLWTYGDSTTQIAVNGQHTFNDVGNFEVCLSLLGAESCANPYCQIIPVVPNAIVVPNVFSPNGDGSNEVLNLFFDWAEVVEMTILNRWGNVIAVVLITDYDDGWNGKVNNDGAIIPDGVYFYKYKITTKVGGLLEGHSFVHLVTK